jgi:hypothetical protein
MKRSAVTALELFNELSGCFEKLEEEVKDSAIKFIEGVWEDFLKELEAAFGDAFELGLEGGNLQETFALLDRLVAQHRGKLEALARATESRPSPSANLSALGPEVLLFNESVKHRSFPSKFLFPPGIGKGFRELLHASRDGAGELSRTSKFAKERFIRMQSARVTAATGKELKVSSSSDSLRLSSSTEQQLGKN